MLDTKWSGLAFNTTKMRIGTNESADVSPFLPFRNKPGIVNYVYTLNTLDKGSLPKMTLQQFKMQITLSRGAR